MIGQNNIHHPIAEKPGEGEFGVFSTAENPWLGRYRKRGSWWREIEGMYRTTGSTGDVFTPEND